MGVVLFVIVMLLMSKRLQRQIVSLEGKFMDNLNERELRRTGRKNNLVRNMHLAHMEVNGECAFIGKRLEDANIRKEYGVNIVSIKRGLKRINIPKGDSRLFPGDVVSVIGTDEQIQKFLDAVEPEEISVDETENEEHFELERIVIPKDSPLIGKNDRPIGNQGKRFLSCCRSRTHGRYIFGSDREYCFEGDGYVVDCGDKSPD